jgi:hypothetical protein
MVCSGIGVDNALIDDALTITLHYISVGATTYAINII